MMRTRWISTGALLLAAAVAAGALGAHGLRTRLDSAALALWETAVRYMVIGGFGLLALGLAAHVIPRRGWAVAGACLAFGTIVFSGTIAAIALGGPRWLGAVTPVGGVLLIVGFVAMAIAAARR
jgi:uncharacterized membrane protein YgdD (TMEM256/DUF423 family)